MGTPGQELDAESERSKLLVKGVKGSGSKGTIVVTLVNGIEPEQKILSHDILYSLLGVNSSIVMTNSINTNDSC